MFGDVINDVNSTVKITINIFILRINRIIMENDMPKLKKRCLTDTRNILSFFKPITASDEGISTQIEQQTAKVEAGSTSSEDTCTPNPATTAKDDSAALDLGLLLQVS